MGKFFYSKLALNNLKHNKNAYVPYMIASIGVIFTYFLFIAIGKNDGIKNVPNKDALYSLFSLGEIVVTIFAIIFILYANSFLIKRRKKEFGLYAILGLEKRHVAYVMFYETLFMGLITIVIGIVFGIVFGKLIFLAFLKLLNVTKDSTFQLQWRAIIKTVILFSGINLITLVFNYLGVRLANPIALLKGDQQGEKEPKTPILMTIVGIASLAIGYYMALNVKSALSALNLFFIAVLFVILGTHALFTSGSITILKTLKKSKKIFYQPNNFISISSMIYRMKQNAAGLATICILSTMVLVIASTTVALYVGQEDMLRERCPYDIMIEADANEIDHLDLINEKVKEVAESNHIKIKDNISFKYSGVFGLLTDNEFKKPNNKSMESMELDGYGFKFLTTEEYSKITNESITLGENEIIYLNGKKDYAFDNLVIGNMELSIKEKGMFKNLKVSETNFSQAVFIIMNKSDLKRVGSEIESIVGKTEGLSEIYCSNTNIKGSSKNRYAFSEELEKELNVLNKEIDYTSLDLDRNIGYSVFGGLLFIGAFLGLLFLLATVLIIYFKQVSEGFDDRNRFIILKKVGMDQGAIKKTINHQIVMVFFLPLIGAIIHIAFAFKMICAMLNLMYLTNVTLFVLCTVGSIAVFSIIYIIVYAMTAKVYFKIVKEDE